jgi:hypothetical protein
MYNTPRHLLLAAVVSSLNWKWNNTPFTGGGTACLPDGKGKGEWCGKPVFVQFCNCPLPDSPKKMKFY